MKTSNHSHDPLETLKKILSVTVIDDQLLKQAFTHRSYLNESKKPVHSNERLEFLGDSVLSFLVSEHLYRTFPSFPEGHLTNIRSSIVKTTTLAEIAGELHLGSYLLLSRGEEESGGRNNPSILADTFEALLGAIFIDQGIESAHTIVQSYLFPRIERVLKEKLFKDAKSMFQEIVQLHMKISPLYKVIDERGPDHAKVFTIGVYVGETLFGEGKGKSKQEGEQIAASAALEKWKKKEYTDSYGSKNQIKAHGQT